MAGLLAQHVDHCRHANRHLRSSWAIVIVESNNPGIALNLCLSLARDVKLINCKFVTNCKENAGDAARNMPGSPTTYYNKQNMMHIITTRYMQPGRICFHKPFMQSEHERVRTLDLKGEIVQEHRNFCKQMKECVDRDGNMVMRPVYTGKPPAGAGDDDYVICSLLAAYWHDEFWRNKKYMPYWVNIIQ